MITVQYLILWLFTYRTAQVHVPTHIFYNRLAGLLSHSPTQGDLPVLQYIHVPCIEWIRINGVGAVYSFMLVAGVVLHSSLDIALRMCLLCVSVFYPVLYCVAVNAIYPFIVVAYNICKSCC